MNILQEYQQQLQKIQASRITVVSRKIKELEEILKYADITSFLVELKNTKSPPLEINTKTLAEGSQLDKVKIVEKIFADELTFLFYFNLSNNVFNPRSNRGLLPKDPESILQYPERFVPKILEMDQKLLKLGSPRDRLITILTKDSEIKRWFFRWIDDIMGYRQKTIEKMSYVVDRLTTVSNNTETKATTRHDTENRTYWEGYDIRKIGSVTD